MRMHKTYIAIGVLLSTIFAAACGSTACHTTKDCSGSQICSGDGVCVDCTKLGDPCSSSSECCGTTTCDPKSVAPYTDVCTQF